MGNKLKGILLVIIIWIINTFIAFVPFSTQSNTRIIILTWFIVDLIFIFILYKQKFFNKTIVITALIFTSIMISFYFLPLGPDIPSEAIELNDQLSQQNIDRYDYAKDLFFELEKKYTSPIRQYLLEPWNVFIIKNFEYFWEMEEGSYADSNIQGRMYRKLLLDSERFSKDEVKMHQSFCSNSPHLLINIYHPEKEIWADFWAVDNFPRFESNQTYEFGMRTIRPCNQLIGEKF